MIKAEAKNVGSGSVSGRVIRGASVTVQADEASNALVITAPASIYPSMRSVIQQLDIPRAQVHIEAIIAEVSLDTSRELGVQWLAGEQGNGAFSSQFSGTGVTIPGLIGSETTSLSDGALLGFGSIDDDGLSILFQTSRASRPGGITTEIVLLRWWDISGGTVGQFHVEGRFERALGF